MTDVDPRIFQNRTIREDWVDLRDQKYQPNLNVLAEEVLLPCLASDDPTGLERPSFGVRNQGVSGRCAGYALANLIDLQRSIQRQQVDLASAAVGSSPAPVGQAVAPEIVSADMLYWMAYFHDRYPDLEESAVAGEGIRTLRSAIKGFYHHGVCPDWPQDSIPPHLGIWQSESYRAAGPVAPQLYPTVAQAKKARELGLGAYYRVASVLNHFHAAINDAGGILVSANIHGGWQHPFNPHANGRIGPMPIGGISGTHAFVIVGYDREGFHVLNSWGKGWGGYRNQMGVALWPYEDWARNIIDSWVLRLGVSAPKAFGASVGEKGIKGAIGPARSGSIPCFELMGHYMHLDDGFHVETGAYPSSPSSWSKTRSHLEQRLNLTDTAQPQDYDGVVVWIPGSLEGIKSAFSAAVRRKAMIKNARLYPYTLFWCNGFVEKSLEVLHGLFDSCEEQAGPEAAHLDALIENRVRGVGRAFWRDIETSARRAVVGTGELPHEPDEQDKTTRISPGFVASFMADLIQLTEDKGAELHIVAEGAGALVLHEVLTAMTRPGKLRDHFAGHQPEEVFSSVQLIYPAICMQRAQKQIIPLLNAMNRKTKRRGGRRKADLPTVAPLVNLRSVPSAQVYIPSQELEDRLTFGAYRKSILHLVSRAFEDRNRVAPGNDASANRHIGTPRDFLGMADLAVNRRGDLRKAITQITDIQSRTHTLNRIPQQVLNNDSALPEYILSNIKKARITGQFTKREI